MLVFGELVCFDIEVVVAGIGNKDYFELNYRYLLILKANVRLSLNVYEPVVH